MEIWSFCSIQCWSGCIQCIVSSSGPHNSRQSQTDWRRSTGVPWKWLKGLKNLLYEERLKELDYLFVKKRRLSRDLITVSQYLKGSCKGDRCFLFTRSQKGKTGDDGRKLSWERFHLDIIKNFFTVRTISHWNNLPMYVESQPLEVSRWDWTGC